MPSDAGQTRSRARPAISSDPWAASAVERRDVRDLLPYAANARMHSDEQVTSIAASIAEYGFVNPVLVDEQGEIIAGHGRVMAAKMLGLGSVPVIVREGLSDLQKRGLRIADNKIALNSTWDDALLARELAALGDEGIDLAITGFATDEIDRLLAGIDAEQPEEREQDPGARAEPGGEDDPADADADPPRQVITRPGDLWLLGEHRLLCGDSTNAADVARVMGQERAALCFTSPPYGNQRDYTTGGVSDWDALMNGVFANLGIVMAPAGQVLVNLGLIHRENEWQPYWSRWLEWMRTQSWRRFGLYVWDQGPGLPGDWNGRLSPAFEFIFHFNRESRKPNKIIPCRWAGHVNSSHGGMRAKDGTVGDWQHAGQGVQEFRIPDNVLRITRHKARGIETEHPAVFPVGLPEFVMRSYADEGDALFEPFSGSGTTILAGQRTGRRVRAIELAPAYVDLTIARWKLLHPTVPVVLDADGRSYDAVMQERVGADREAA